MLASSGFGRNGEMTDQPYSKQQKDKARKRGTSLKSKCVELGEHCGIFTAVAYWEPTHKRMEAVMYLPNDQSAPDFKELFGDLTCDDYQQTIWKKRPGPLQQQSNTKKRRLSHESSAANQETTHESRSRRVSQRLKTKGGTHEYLRRDNDEVEVITDSRHSVGFDCAGVDDDNPGKPYYQSNSPSGVTTRQRINSRNLRQKVITLLGELVLKFDSQERRSSDISFDKVVRN